MDFIVCGNPHTGVELGKGIGHFLRFGLRSQTRIKGDELAVEYVAFGRTETYRYTDTSEKHLQRITKAYQAQSSTSRSVAQALLEAFEISNEADLESAKFLDLALLVELMLEPELGIPSDWVTEEDRKRYAKGEKKQIERFKSLLQTALVDCNLRPLISDAIAGGCL